MEEEFRGDLRFDSLTSFRNYYSISRFMRPRALFRLTLSVSI